MQTIWGWLPAIYLFLGGLGAGCFLVAAVFELTNKRYQFDFCPITLVGATVAGPVLTIGTLLLIFDLGAGLREPWRISFMLTHITSVMTWGVWILSLFIPVSFGYGFLELMDVYPQTWDRITGRIPRLAALPLRKVKRILAVVGAVLAVMTAIYTGVLISAVGPAIPFWSTPILPFVPIPMLPLLFLVSALSTGIGLTVDLAATLTIKHPEDRIRRLPAIHLAVIGLETLLLGLLLITAFFQGGASAMSAAAIVSGTHSIVFWGFIVIPGFVFPFGVHAYAMGMGRHSLASGLASGVGIVAAGLFLRYLILVSGLPPIL